jgi:hypothetical protein
MHEFLPDISYNFLNAEAFSTEASLVGLFLFMP